MSLVPTLDLRVHVCRACRRPNAPCGIGEAFYCVPCAPPSFWPKNREERA